MRISCLAALLAILPASCAAVDVDGIQRALDQVRQPLPPLPSPKQLAWHELEYYAFVHFNMDTFTGNEWGAGTEDPKLFAPPALDCRQWARVARDAGMQAIILTAKHHDGFCLWPSKYSEHTVASSPWKNGKGDVLRELSDACREHGLKFGVYLSPWDRNSKAYGTGDAYNQYFANQLTEVLTQYGPVFEVWFDGACGEGPSGKRQVYDWKLFHDTVYRHQPDAVIFSDVGPDVRWMGNERGIVGETNWAMLSPAGFEPGANAPHVDVLNTGQIDGTHWIPAECDVSIRPGWYYHAEQDDQVKSLEQLQEIWFGSVGRGANLLLNLPVDRRGLVHENDVARLMEFKAWRDAAFGTDLAQDAEFEGEAQVEQRTLQLHSRFARAAEIDVIELAEFLELGQRVKSFTIRGACDGATPTMLAHGTTIGRKRLVRFAPQTVTDLWIDVDDARATPLLSAVRAYRTPPRATLRAIPPAPTPAPPPAAAETAQPLRKAVHFVRAPDPGLAWRMYEASGLNLDALETSTPIADGASAPASLDELPPGGDVVVAWNGFVQVPESGAWTLRPSVRDGVSIWIGEDLVLDGDDVRASASAAQRLEQGWHPLRIRWLRSRAGDELSLAVESPSGQPARIAFGH
jgi:alpha-L-fucosidase